MIESLIPLVPILPLFGAMVMGFFGKRIQAAFGENLTGILGCTAPALAALIAFGSFFELISLPEEARVFVIKLGQWVGVADFQVEWAFRYDPLSALMLMIITGIGTLIHIYSMGYMHGDKSFWRFFSYINLFLAAMLMLVLGDNLLIMFLGWEGVGLCSYLLIGFWFTNSDYAYAGRKAFIVNRIGDLGFLTGMFLLIYFSAMHYDIVTLSYGELANRMEVLSKLQIWGLPMLEVTALAFFVGAMGKSAQIPLYVWLPDAMAGPTPVSALIHAATMVTAGVYMIGRMYFMYSMAPIALQTISFVAAATCFLSATIGMAQYDIKKVLAYSTVSQLGYMFLAMGVGAYSAGIFHLLTHAAFKAALFMGSGAIIVALHHEQDMRKMGGLLKKMPVTGYSFIAATLAIMGFPLTSGFFSKDEILEKAFEHAPALWVLAFTAAGITSFYMWRLVFMTFFGKYRGDEHTWDHCVEQPKRTTVPVAILAVAALTLGFLNVPDFLGGSYSFSNYLSPVVKDMDGHALEAGAVLHAAAEHAAEAEEHGDLWIEWALMIGSVLWTFITAGLAYYYYMKAPQQRERLMAKAGPKRIFQVLHDKYYVDEFYDWALIRPLIRLFRFLANFDKYVVDGAVNLAAFLSKGLAQIAGFLDKGIVDGIVNELAWFSQATGKGFSLMQSGRIQGLVASTLVLFTAVFALLIFVL
ncbi:MAG: NADH-quinone oxidoreductase subunit L [bacterium]|nr:NADH-quinone oxidoreductase subunit L [bacterium]